MIRWFALVNGIEVMRHQRVGNAAADQGCLCGRRWQWHVALIMLLLSSGMVTGDAGSPRVFERTDRAPVATRSTSEAVTVETVGPRTVTPAGDPFIVAEPLT